MVIIGRKELDELKTRMETLEQALKHAVLVMDTTLVAAEKARIAAQGAEVAAIDTNKASREFNQVISKAIEDTPGLPFDSQHAVLGRVSAIRAHLKRLEERSAQ